MKSILAWHFVNSDRRLRYRDGREVKVGTTYKVDAPISLCNRGLHASIRAIDALSHAPGPVICRVRVSGVVKHGDDKIVATERKVIAMADATDLLFRFSVDCAARAMERVGWTDERSWRALDIRLAHLQGLATDADLAEARQAADAAYAAAAAAYAAAYAAAAADAAYAAAYAAADAAADAAAADAAYAAYAAAYAADAAARDEARKRERDEQNAEFEYRLFRLLKCN